MANFNELAPNFGAQAGDVYAATLAAGEAAGTVAGPLWPLAIGASIFLVPMLTFFNLWPNWGSTLYGEVRGASDYKRNFWGMAAAIIVTTVGALILFALIAKTIGWDFYNKANGAFWNYTFGYVTDPAPLPIWPYPALFAAFMVKSRVRPVHRRPAHEPVVVRLVGHAVPELDARDLRRLHRPHAARVGIPDRAAHQDAAQRPAVDGDPGGDHLVSCTPTTIFSMSTLALDATVVIAITFLGSTIAGTVMPWRAKDVFDGSPIAQVQSALLAGLDRHCCSLPPRLST